MILAGIFINTKKASAAFILQHLSLVQQFPSFIAVEHINMACVEAAIPVPNSRKKTDELFLCWLSEPSTQELLRKELSSISGVPYSELDDKATNEAHTVVSEYGGFLSPSSAVTSVLRPGSPNIRTPSPPLLTHRSPKSPRGAGRANRSPKKLGGRSPNGKNQVINSGLQQSFDDVDGDEGVPSSSSILNSHICHQLETVHTDSSELVSNQRGKRSRSHSPKPESLPVGPGLNQGPKLGTNSTPIPRFYFPNGKPCPEENLQERFAELAKWFEQTENGRKANLKQMPEILKVSPLSVCYLYPMHVIPKLYLPKYPKCVHATSKPGYVCCSSNLSCASVCVCKDEMISGHESFKIWLSVY